MVSAVSNRTHALPVASSIASTRVEAGSPAFEPVVVRGVDLEHHPEGLLPLSPQTPLFPSYLPLRTDTIVPENAPQSLPADDNTFVIPEIFAEVGIVDALILRPGKLDDLCPDIVVSLCRAGTAPETMNRPFGAFHPHPGEKTVEGSLRNLTYRYRFSDIDRSIHIAFHHSQSVYFLHRQFHLFLLSLRQVWLLTFLLGS